MVIHRLGMKLSAKTILIRSIMENTIDHTEGRKPITSRLLTAAFQYLRRKYHNRTLAFFSEVKVDNSLRVDLLAITYDDEVTIFEVKSCKADFKVDRKWFRYLNYCNYFYFITVPGAIELSDLPDGVGLIHFVETKDGNKTYNIIRESIRFKGIGLTHRWFSWIYKKLAFRVASEDGIEGVL